MSHDPSSGAPSHDHRRHGPEGARRRPSRRGTRLRHGSIPSDWPCASPPARDADRRPLQRRPPSWRPAPRCRRQDTVSRSSAELPSGLHPQLQQPEPPAMCYLSSWRCSPERIRHPELNCSRRATPPSSKFNSDRDIPRTRGIAPSIRASRTRGATSLRASKCSARPSTEIRSLRRRSPLWANRLTLGQNRRETLEFRWPEIEITILSGVPVRIPELLRACPGQKARLVGPQAVRGIEHMILTLGAAQQMEGDEARHLVEPGAAPAPDLLESLGAIPDHLEPVHRHIHALFPRSSMIAE